MSLCGCAMESFNRPDQGLLPSSDECFSSATHAVTASVDISQCRRLTNSAKPGFFFNRGWHFVRQNSPTPARPCLVFQTLRSVLTCPAEQKERQKGKKKRQQQKTKVESHPRFPVMEQSKPAAFLSPFLWPKRLCGLVRSGVCPVQYCPIGIQQRPLSRGGDQQLNLTWCCLSPHWQSYEFSCHLSLWSAIECSSRQSW